MKQESTVYFCPLPGQSTLEQRVSAMQKLVASYNFAAHFQPNDKVAIKTHFGEKNNITHIAADSLVPVIKKLKELRTRPFLTETSTLYMGERSNAIDHLHHAFNHGFTYEKLQTPIIMADGLMGDSEVEVDIPGILYNKVSIARDAVLCDGIVALSHPTGHMLSGLGACIKNLGMGLSSRRGKLRQHSSVKPIIKSKCTFCKVCMKWCPETAIIEKDHKAFILPDKCVGCGECYTVCKFDSVYINYEVGSDDIQRRMAEYALGAVINKMNKTVYINVMTDMTSECDCMNVKQKPIIPDIGLLLSTDAVAIDQATLDLTRKHNGKDISHLSYPKYNPDIQLEHAEKIGLGVRKYTLKEI